jgi:hypothetical protein
VEQPPRGLSSDLPPIKGAGFTGFASKLDGSNTPLQGVTAKEGEYGAYAYGARYGRDPVTGSCIDYPTPSGAVYRMTLEKFSVFTDAVKKVSGGVIPQSKFRVSDPKDGPRYKQDGAETDAMDALAAKFEKRTDDGSVSGINGGLGQGQNFAG